jgi:RimJ/RimL family protein N-acetyltransferase
MEFRETTQEDLDFMANNSVSRGIQKHCPEQADFMYTLEHESKPLGVGGFRLINLTTAWAWVDLSHLAGHHTIVCYRVIREWMEKFVEDHKIKRLQAYIEMDFEVAIRMAEHLGFKYESTMEGFMGDKDAFMYKRIF